RPRRPFPAATLPAAKTLENFGEIGGVIGIFQSWSPCRLMARLQAEMDLEKRYVSLKRKIDARLRSYYYREYARRPCGNAARGASVEHADILAALAMLGRAARLRSFCRCFDRAGSRVTLQPPCGERRKTRPIAATSGKANAGPMPTFVASA